jgi:hypothetical protein
MRYAKIESKVWHDEKFTQLTAAQQRLFFYILTCPHGNLTGLFVLKEGYIVADLKCLLKDLTKDLTKLIEHGFIKYDFDTSVMWVKNFLKHNPLTNPNQVKAAIKTINQLPETKIIQQFVEVLPEALMQAITKGLLKPEAVTEAVTVTETEENTYVNANAVDHCPHTEIINLYHEILPALPRISTVKENGKEKYNWNGSRMQNLKARWRESERRQSLSWWSDFFSLVSQSDFLMGRTQPTPGRETFMANLEWLILPRNLNKVIEGFYTRKAA